jgi:hypothetical protein
MSKTVSRFPISDWLKISRDTFITGLWQKTKAPRAVDVIQLRVSICNDRLCACLRWGGPFWHLSPSHSLTISLSLLFILSFTSVVPGILGAILLRRFQATEGDSASKKWWYRNNAMVGTAFLILNLMLTVLGGFALAASQICGRWIVLHCFLSGNCFPHWVLNSIMWGFPILFGNIASFRGVFWLWKEYILLLRRRAQNDNHVNTIAGVANSSPEGSGPSDGSVRQLGNERPTLHNHDNQDRAHPQHVPRSGEETLRTSVVHPPSVPSQPTVESEIGSAGDHRLQVHDHNLYQYLEQPECGSNVENILLTELIRRTSLPETKK